MKNGSKEKKNKRIFFTFVVLIYLILFLLFSFINQLKSHYFLH